MNISPQMLAFIGALSVLAGAIVASLTSLFTTLITKRSEERRHYRELVINAAIENWKQVIALTPPEQTIEPLDDYIIHMMKLYDEVLAKKLAPEQLVTKLNELKQQSFKLHRLRTQHVEDAKDELRP